MNHLWEVMLQAVGQGVPEKSLRFGMAAQFSAYMEVSGPFLNQMELKEGQVIEVNPYYRFYEIFKDLYRPDLHDFPKLRDNLTNLMLHQLAQNDVLSGMTREEYYKKLLYEDVINGLFGQKTVEAMELFGRDDREVILSGCLRQYGTGSSLDIFKDMMEELIPDNIVYRSNENPHEILVYVGQRREKEIVTKIEFLVRMFVELPYHVETYYEHHFGIIGIEETMMADEIALC